MKVKIFIVALLCALTLTNCTFPVAGTFTVTNTDGLEYEYEVVVPMTNFVRVKSITNAQALTGEIVIPASVEYSGAVYVVSQIGKRVFEDCTGITQVTLPSTISVIEDKAFKGCTALEYINTPQPLSTIGEYAFDGCSELEDFSLQASISTLGEGCFRNCTSLEEVIFPTSLNNISASAFQGCSNIETIYIDRTILSIGSNAFNGCTSVNEFTSLAATPPTADSNTFNGIDASIMVTVPMASVDQYRTAVGWDHFSNYQGVY
ncbi:MAG: leucine-rich repeat domain-containing protein [Bacteroidales bacterium]|nr:leucine-rich repeat domain-containing protein [Bacteroidales bacterium]